MTRPVRYTPEADRQLLDLYDYIADAKTPDVARRYVDAIMDFCDDLSMFPVRGIARDDIRSGLRTVGFRKRVTIAFTTLDAETFIVGIFYGGQDYDAALSNDA